MSGRGRPRQRATERPVVPTQRGVPGLTRVAVLSDQRLTSEAVRAALRERGFKVLGLPLPSGGAGQRELLRQVAAFRPQVGLLLNELDAPHRFGDAMAVMEAVPGMPWILLTGIGDRSMWGAGLEAGAAVVMPMSIGLQQLVDALARLASGHAVTTAEERSRLLEEWHNRGEEHRQLTARMERLSPREMEVLRALHSGQSVATIAQQGGVTIGTVRSQVKSILRKLEVSSQLAAVAAYQQAMQSALRGHH